MSEIHVNNDVKTQRMKDYVRQLHNHGTETWRCLLVKVKWQILMILIDDIWFQENIQRKERRLRNSVPKMRERLDVSFART